MKKLLLLLIPLIFIGCASTSKTISPEMKAYLSNPDNYVELYFFNDTLYTICKVSELDSITPPHAVYFMPHYNSDASPTSSE